MAKAAKERRKCARASIVSVPLENDKGKMNPPSLYCVGEERRDRALPGACGQRSVVAKNHGSERAYRPYPARKILIVVVLATGIGEVNMVGHVRGHLRRASVPTVVGQSAVAKGPIRRSSL